MDHIEQLKKIRSDAINRLHNSPDFKLAGKLGLLIEELGETVEDAVELDELEEPAEFAAIGTVLAAEETVPQHPSFATPDGDEFADLTSDKMIDELVAEIEGDAAELDALMAEEADGEENDADHIGPFLKPELIDQQYTNGATH